MNYYILICVLTLNKVVWGQICSHVAVEITGNRGEITSPNYPGNFPSNSFCRWKITLADTTGVISFRFQTISMQICTGTDCTCDYVRLWDGENDDAKLIGTYCAMPSQPLGVTEGRHLFVEFSADSSTGNLGFKLLYERNETACHQTRVISNAEGEITTGFYPYFNYGSNLRCSWRLEGQPGHIVVLNVAYLDTERRYDVLRVYDGPSTSSRILSAISGIASNRFYTSTGQYMYLTFITDGSNVRPGFLLRYIIGGDAVTVHTTPPTPGPTLFPPPRVSNPPLLYLEIEGSFVTSDSSIISSFCASSYSSLLRLSADNMMERVNSLMASSQLCSDNRDFQILSSSITKTTMVSRGYPKMNFIMPSAESQSLTNASLCGNEITNYMQVHGNWAQPILPTPGGCASVVWDPPYFNASNNHWICYHDTIPFVNLQ